MIGLLVALTIAGAVELPMGSAPDPVTFPWFPDTLHTFVWFNWELVPLDRMGKTVGATAEQIETIGKAMGLSTPNPVTENQWKRSYITIIRRNWHLLPYDQLLTLLNWTPEELAYTLREDDFLFIKLGNLKPKCKPLQYAPPTPEVQAREAEIAAQIKEMFPESLAQTGEPLFGFIDNLSKPMDPPPAKLPESRFNPRFCSSYFTLYGDPFLSDGTDSLPDGYMDRLAASGVTGVWLQAVLYKLAPYPWDPSLSDRWEERLANLKKITERAKQHGIGIYLYINEPRAMPLTFFDAHPGLKGVTEGDHATICASNPDVQAYIRDSIATICTAAPELNGFFTITASENLTNCWSHYQGAQCPRCKDITPAQSVVLINTLVRDGIAKANTNAKLIAWDWGWQDAWAADAIAQLPKDVTTMSVSEWSLPIERGGVKNTIGEYSISAVGPGPRATKNWAKARETGHQCIAKVQANCTWECASVPYIPALELVAQHAAGVRDAGVNGIMLGWTLGGCPSPNLEVFAEMGRPDSGTPEQVLNTIAERRFGTLLAGTVVRAWSSFSEAFAQYPYGSGLYTGPQQMGPANPLWAEKTNYNATMVCFPYDNVDQWRGEYPVEVYWQQFKKMSNCFDAVLEVLDDSVTYTQATSQEKNALQDEMNVAEACAITFSSVANQSIYVTARNNLASSTTKAPAEGCDTIEKTLNSELENAKYLYRLQREDSRIGYEASNHYFYVPLDLAAKALNCRYLLDTALPAWRANAQQ